MRLRVMLEHGHVKISSGAPSIKRHAPPAHTTTHARAPKYRCHSWRRAAWMARPPTWRRTGRAAPPSGAARSRPRCVRGPPARRPRTSARRCGAWAPTMILTQEGGQARGVGARGGGGRGTYGRALRVMLPLPPLCPIHCLIPVCAVRGLRAHTPCKLPVRTCACA